MTVVLALRCADGVVLGSDSQITDGARGLSYPAQKLHPFGDTAAWGGSGSRAVLFDLEQMFDGCAAAVHGSENITTGRGSLAGTAKVRDEIHFRATIPDALAGSSPP